MDPSTSVTITSKGLADFKRQLKANLHSGVLSLNVSGNRLTDEYIEKLAQENLPNLTSLDLSENFVGENGIKSIVKPTLLCLKINHNKQNFTPEAIQKLVENILKGNLRELSLMEGAIKGNLLGFMTLLVNSHKKPWQLNLACNPITDEVPFFKLFVEDLVSSSYLTHLDLKKCKLGLDAIKEISKILEHNSPIHSLILAENPINNDCLSVLARNLTNNRSLKLIDLSSTIINDECIQYLVTVVKINTVLTHLIISENNLSADSYKKLWMVIRKGTPLLSLGEFSEVVEKEQFVSVLKTDLEHHHSKQEEAFKACSEGDLSQLKSLCEREVSPLGQYNGETLMHLAIRKKHNSIIQYLLLTMRIQLNNQRNADGLTPLEYAKAIKNTDAFNLIEGKFLNDPKEKNIVNPEEIIIRNYYSRQLELQHEEKMKLIGNVLGQSNMVKMRSEQLNRQSLIIETKMGIINCFLNHRDPKKPLQNMCFKAGTEYFLKKVKKQVIQELKMQTDNNNNYDPWPIINLYKNWLEIELDIVCQQFVDWKDNSVDIVEDFVQCQGIEFDTLNSLSKFSEENTKNASPEMLKPFKDHPHFSTIQKMWNKHHLPVIKALHEEVLKAKSNIEMMNKIFEYEVKTYYEIELEKDVQNFVGSNCSQYSKEEQEAMAKQVADDIRKNDAVRYQDKPFKLEKTLESDLHALQLELKLTTEDRDRCGKFSEKLGVKFYLISEDQKKRASHLLERFEKAKIGMQFTLSYLAGFESTQKVKDYLIPFESKCLIEANKEIEEESGWGEIVVDYFNRDPKLEKIRKKMWEKFDPIINVQVGKYKQTPLQQACLYGNVETVEFLIEKGANPELMSTDNYENDYTPWHFACYCLDPMKVTDILDQLYKNSKNVSIKGVTDRTPLHTAALFNNKAAAVWLINKGADVNAREEKGKSTEFTPLHNACKEGALEVCELLIEKGAQLDLEDDRRNTPLMLALLYGTKNVSSGDDKGNLTVSQEVIPRYVEIVKLFMKQGQKLTVLQEEDLKKDEGLWKTVQLVLEAAKN